MNFKHMTVRAKLTAAFATLAVLIALVAGLATKSLNDANNRFANFVQGINARLLLSYEVRTAVEQRAILARDLANAATPQARETIKAEVMKAHDDVQTRMAKLMKMAAEPGVSQQAHSLMTKMAEIEAQYAPVALGIVELASQGNREEAVAKMNADCRPLLAALINAAHDYRDYTSKHSEELLAQSAADYAIQRNLLFGGCLVAFAAALVAGALITRSLTRALGAEPAVLSEAVSRVADGDLSQSLDVERVDTTSVLASLARMQSSLSGVVANVRANSESVATASSQIAQGNQDLSQRTEEQASALQQTAATMEELNTTVRNNTDNAKQANQLAQGASAIAAKGGEVVGQVVTTMQGISESSRKIGDIIGVIDGIAFQTNILALNAAVEAARAGEQGRGFAVVAGEVRTLAQRSAEAAKEIKGLIGRSVEQVEQGSVLVDQAGQTMGEIVGSIKRVSDIVAEISTASQEQSSGISQVGDAVGQMDQVTQQNAALVEEGAAAAESLKGQAQQLVQAVAVFKLSGRVAGQHNGTATPAAISPTHERRGADRAKNVIRPAFAARPSGSLTKSTEASVMSGTGAKTGTDDWTSF
ncbi:methyl-accepting chemotaxis protein [Roseateles sp. BYS78W]|uniref:Methyl-accepting chemotaxis protein n=1 Tax=Pelomonas candidula TaxID=3299025 RepID=A0ABW7H8S2_9BURK